MADDRDYAYRVRCQMEAERRVVELEAIIAQHNLCHDLHGKVGAREFADGCAAEQRKLYGCAPDVDKITRACDILKRALDKYNGVGDAVIADVREAYEVLHGTGG